MHRRGVAHGWGRGRGVRGRGRGDHSLWANVSAWWGTNNSHYVTLIGSHQQLG